MANPQHLAILKEALKKDDIDIWNSWREKNPEIIPDLFDANLRGAYLSGANLEGADLGGAYLFKAYLNQANLHNADLHGADLSEADLSEANLSQANLSWISHFEAAMREAHLSMTIPDETDLGGARFNGTDMSAVNLDKATLGFTTFVDVDLSTAKRLETVRHRGPSYIDVNTIYKSRGNIPESFLRGAGVPGTMITFMRSLVGKAIEYYSAFISYSTADEHFASRLHNDLQANGVRVWFAPEDLKIGDPLKHTIDEAVRLYDKLILVLSENSINRAWVYHEFSKAIEKEKQQNRLVLFPIRLDDSVFETTEQWAYDIRQRYIGDFRNWTNPLLYQNAINRLLRDLNANPHIK